MTNQNHFCLTTNSTDNNICFRRSHGSLLAQLGDQRTYITDDGSAEVTVSNKEYGNTVRSTAQVKNISEEPIDITALGSAWICIKNNGSKPWYAKDKYIIHYCLNSWLGEGQWRSLSIEDMGLYQTFDEHDNNSHISLSSCGSMSTSQYYPLVILEDTETNTMHYFELESGGCGWYIEIGAALDEDDENLYVFLSAMCEKNDGWHKTLATGACITSPATVWGSIDGDFDDAAAQLTSYKRSVSLVGFAEGYPPVCFNNYMNCSWADPAPEKLLPLMDAAAKLGVEIFCVDDGWFSITTAPTEKALGDWNVNDAFFAPYGLQGIIDHALDLGMKFGIWLEIEACEENADSYIKDNLLTRRGHVIGGKRAFFDFRRTSVQNSIERIFDKLYSMGVRYIKNDYNQTTGIGADGAESLSESVSQNADAFYLFIDKIREKYPDLIIENCGSGAMRSDGKTLSHFHLQSTSDQEVYSCYPSILSGSMACMPPEKAGIWSYPYPIRFKKRIDYTFTGEELESFKDGKETVFNMVNSMLGVMYLSGRPDAFDDFNTSLVKEGIQVYKRIRHHISKAYPVYPSGRFRISDTGIYSFGLKDGNELYLAVWRINDNSDRNGEIDLSKYGTVKSVQKLYPSLKDYSCTVCGNLIRVSLPTGNSAMLINVEMAI